MMNTVEIKGYITNLGKYNEGELVGKWITFPIDEDDLQLALKEIGCCYYDENGDYVETGYEEYFFTTYESALPIDLGEYESIETLNEYAEKLDEWTYEEYKLQAAWEIWGIKEALENGPDDYVYYDGLETDYDLGYYYIMESGCYDTREFGILGNYIDYEAFGRDVRLESNGGFTSNGWIEHL